MAKSELERKSDQLRSQIESLRQNMDDLLSSYNRLIGAGADAVAQAQAPVTSMARQMRSNVADMADSLPSMPKVGGFSWWIPVAVVGAIGVGIWAFNTFFPNEASNLNDQFSQTTQNVGNQVAQTAQQVGDQVNRAADQAQSQFSSTPRDQFSGPTGNQPSFGQSQTPFGEQRS